MVDADEIARYLVAPGSQVLRLLSHTFGLEILLPDGSLDRPKLGSIVFTDPKKRTVLDQIMRSFIRDEIQVRIKKESEKAPLVGLDAALLIEHGHYQEYRPLIVVAVEPATQIQRLMERDGFTHEEAQARIASQLPCKEKVRLADHVIQNDGSLDELTQQTLKLIAHLRHQP